MAVIKDLWGGTDPRLACPIPKHYKLHSRAEAVVCGGVPLQTRTERAITSMHEL